MCVRTCVCLYIYLQMNTALLCYAVSDCLDTHTLSLSQLIFAALKGHTRCSNDNDGQVIRQVINFTCDTDIQQSPVILQTYVDCSMQILRCG